jgi:feruloyl esterase
MTSSKIESNRRGGFSRICLVLLTIWALAPTVTLTAQKLSDENRPAPDCSALAGHVFADIKVTSSAKIAATATVPGYCKVNGTKDGTQFDIEVRLPDDWQGRYVQEGGAGFDGFLMPVGKIDVALQLHAVQVVTNGGHRDPSGNDLLNDPAKIQLYAHTAIGEGAQFGKAVTSAYYGKKPKYSYFEGCSNGGRGALNVADKYGAEFDAVIAGAPSRNVAGQIEQWTRAATLALPAPPKLAAIYEAAVAKCDALDGVKDGIISNWADCDFDPVADAPKSAEFTAQELASVKALMTDLLLEDGTLTYSGYYFGNMAIWGPAYAVLGVGHMRNIVLNDADWSPRDFTAGKYHEKIVAITDGKYGFSAGVEGLAKFLKSGKKIIIWQGSDDSLLSIKDTIRTWQPVSAAAGEAAGKNSRMYVASGVNHCGGGAGADVFDLLSPLVAWVEKGADPGTPIATKFDAAGIAKFTRPLCQFPAYPQYLGSGDVNSAKSYVCSLPRRREESGR